MSEKIYAYLLRLFPSAFRRHYEEEALQLLRDRLSDERGLFRRLRLSFDLMVDMIVALPQAYRNSYPDVTVAASLTPQFDGVPPKRDGEGSVKTSWQTEAGRIVSRWNEAGKRIEYSPLWLQVASQSVDRSVKPEVTNFTAHSPLGSGEWFVPWNARWNVPGKSMD